jgi:hypothetical protein
VLLLARYADVVIGRIALIFTATLMLAVGQTSALADPADVATTQAYIQANGVLVQYAAARLDTGQALLEGVFYKTKALCSNAAANSPQDEQSTMLSNEVIGAMVTADFHAALPEINTFLQVAERSHWSNHALTSRVHAYAAKLNVQSRLPSPNLCGDIHAWAASGFRSLPASTVRFDERFMPNWVALGELPPSLRPYERPQERSLLARSARAEARLTDFEAEAVETWGEIMNVLVLSP